MKILLITVAGMSTRFSESIGSECLKCIYYKNDFSESLLYQMIYKNLDFDRYVIVGGFKYEELKNAVDNHFSELRDRLILLKNEKYAEYGSGYSLYLGLEAVKELDFDQLVFAEGDLYVDNESFMQVCKTENNVITCNREAILAKNSVAFYYDSSYGIHYIYDTNHSTLEIKEPFGGIFNSGQIWKFTNKKRLEKAMLRVSQEAAWQGTNLNLIQKYFGELKQEEYEIVEFKIWINCNTIADFERTLEE